MDDASLVLGNGSPLLWLTLLLYFMPLGPASTSRSPYTDKDILFAKLYKCVHVAGEKTMRDVARTMYSDKSMKSQKGRMHLNEYCTKDSHRLNPECKDFFDCDLMEKDFDINFAFFLITDICKPLFSTFHETCQNHITNLKNLRNKINHSYEHDEDNLRKLANNLKFMAKHIYEGVGKALKTNFEDDLTKVVTEIDDIMAAAILEGGHMTENDIEKFMEDMTSKLIIKGRGELMRRYKKLKVLNPLTTWADDDEKVKDLEIDKIFTPLRTTDRKDEISMECLLTEKIKKKGEEVLPNALLLHGLAGSGKTSLCRYIIHDWQKPKQKSTIIDLSVFDFVFLIEVRKVMSKNFMQFLREQLMHETCADFKPEDIEHLLENLDILFIIDGYDEKKDASNLVQDIFMKFSGQRFIITTRHKRLNDAINQSKRHKIAYLSIEVCGFDKERRQEFSEKVFSVLERDEDRREETKKFLDYLNGKGKVLDKHLELPLTIALLIILWRYDSEIVNQVTTATRLYQELFLLCKVKLAGRIHDRHSMEFSKLLTALEDLMLSLGQHAWKMLHEESYELNEQTLTDICDECESKGIKTPDEFLSAFLMCEKDEDSDTDSLVCAFLHKTQMEYLAAAFLTEEVRKRSLQDVTRQHRDWSRFVEVIVYLTGHMACQEILHGKEGDLFWLINLANINEPDYNFWWNIVHESRPTVRNNNSSQCLRNSRIDKTIAEKKLTRTWTLNETNVVSGLKLLSNTPVILHYLKIEIIDKNPHDILFFLETLQGVGQHLALRKHKCIGVELDLRGTEGHEGIKTADEFIHSLTPWGTLKKFTGSLKKPYQFSMQKQLENLRVTMLTSVAMQSLVNLPKRLRHPRVILQLPRDCEPSILPAVDYNGDMEVTMKNMKDGDINWMIKVLQCLFSKYGIWRLSLEVCEITDKEMEGLVRRLSRILLDKLTIDPIIHPDNEFKEALQKKEKALKINWI